MLVAGQRVADQNRIAARGIEDAVGLVGNLEWGEFDAGVELERLVRPKMGDKGIVRLVRLPRRIPGLTRARQIGLGHVACALPALPASRADYIAVYCQPSRLQSTFSLISTLSPPINAAMVKAPQTPALADLRKEIDRIDKAMHQLLMERGEIIDRLIAVKRSQETGTSAFRPAREAEMMRRLVKRHKGFCRLIRPKASGAIIISTFTYVQAPFSVHADLSAATR